MYSEAEFDVQLKHYSALSVVSHNSMKLSFIHNICHTCRPTVLTSDGQIGVILEDKHSHPNSMSVMELITLCVNTKEVHGQNKIENKTGRIQPYLREDGIWCTTRLSIYCSCK